MDIFTVWIHAALASFADKQARVYLELSCAVPEEYAKDLEDKGYMFADLSDAIVEKLAA